MTAEAFTLFYRRYYRLILTVAQQRLLGFSDAEDITAEVFRIAWKHASDGHELTLPWVYQVLRNVIGNEYRRTSRADQLTQRLGRSLPESLVATNDEALELRRLIRALPAHDRELLYMTYWEDLSGGEIAAILGCTQIAVRVRLMRARRKLKVMIDEPEMDLTAAEAENGRA